MGAAGMVDWTQACGHECGHGVDIFRSPCMVLIVAKRFKWIGADNLVSRKRSTSEKVDAEEERPDA